MHRDLDDWNENTIYRNLGHKEETNGYVCRKVVHEFINDFCIHTGCVFFNSVCIPYFNEVANWNTLLSFWIYDSLEGTIQDQIRFVEVAPLDDM